VCQWLPLADAINATRGLIDPDEEFGTDIVWGRHLVFGVDEAPFLYVWEAETDTVRLADTAGRWLPGTEAATGTPLPAFLQRLFFEHPARRPKGGWAEAIKRVSS
jgi:hypothetical protein